MDVEGLSKRVQKYLRTSGHNQKELAKQLDLHPKVLSRKLRGNSGAYLTQREVRQIIMTLAAWHAVSTRDDVLQLLEAAEMEPVLFRDEDWQNAPLNTLAPQRVYSKLQRSISPSESRQNLPAPTTRLIGREWAVARLKPLLEREDVRLVTLVGTGGSGKTRLALHLASELVDSYAHGVWFVLLSGVSNPEQVPMSIIQALQISTASNLSALEGLISYLRQKQLLLLLDNFEHVEAAAGTVAEILAAAPGLKILVTSRAMLHVYGEHAFSVPPLDIPDPVIPLETEKLQIYSSLQLFVERAQAVVPDFALTDANAAIIAQICARVDGLPLALELAAARVKVLPPTQLFERLSNALLLVLTGGARDLPSRQQTLRNTIDWSYNLLSAVEQASFRRMGVFAGGWSLEAAEAMMQETITSEDALPLVPFPLDVLEQLLDQSLLLRQLTANQQAHFTMLATLREYALEQLDAHGELEQLRDWHARYYLQEVEAAETGLRGPEQLAWLARLTADHDNIRAAQEWLLQKARERSPRNRTTKNKALTGSQALSMCLRLAAAFRPYREWRGYLTEGRSWLKAVLEVPCNEVTEPGMLMARAKALSEASRLMWLQNSQTEAVELAEQSIALWKHVDDPHGLAMALLHRAWAAHGMGEYELAKRAYRDGLSLLSPETDPWLYAMLLFHLAAAAGFTSEFELMRSYYAQSQELFERVSDKSSCADLLKDYGGLLILAGSYQEAVDSLLQSLQLCYELNHKQFITTGLVWFSFAVGMRKEPDEATAALYTAQLRGVADHLMDEIGMTHWSQTLDFTQLAQQHIRSFVSEQDWETALAKGRTLTIEQALALAEQLKDGL
jgi:predicted ATPase